MVYHQKAFSVWTMMIQHGVCAYVPHYQTIKVRHVEYHWLVSIRGLKKKVWVIGDYMP